MRAEAALGSLISLANLENAAPLASPWARRCATRRSREPLGSPPNHQNGTLVAHACVRCRGTPKRPPRGASVKRVFTSPTVGPTRCVAPPSSRGTPPVLAAHRARVLRAADELLTLFGLGVGQQEPYQTTLPEWRRVGERGRRPRTHLSRLPREQGARRSNVHPRRSRARPWGARCWGPHTARLVASCANLSTGGELPRPHARHALAWLRNDQSQS